MRIARTLRAIPTTPKRGWPWDVETPAPGIGKWPRLTVITPSFGQGAYIEETIRSVLLQGYPDLQYLVVDGGSGDGTVEVLNRYGDFIDHWVSEKDSGQTHAINKGLALADGDIVAWINSDDCYAQGALLTAVAALIDNGTQWVAGSCRWKHDSEVGVVHRSRVEAPVFEWLLQSPIQQPASLWRRELHERLGTLDASLRYVMDQELFLRLRVEGIVPIEVPHELATLRLHPESKTVSTQDAFRQEMLRLLLPKYRGRIPPSELPLLSTGVTRKWLAATKSALKARNVPLAADCFSRAVQENPRAAISGISTSLLGR